MLRGTRNSPEDGDGVGSSEEELSSNLTPVFIWTGPRDSFFLSFTGQKHKENREGLTLMGPRLIKSFTHVRPGMNYKIIKPTGRVCLLLNHV